MQETGKKIRIVTHNGRFHTDEIFAVAALKIYLGDAETEVVRSRDPKVWETGDYVVDVGTEYDPSRGRFDHHQEGGAGERNGIAYSSFGAVWKSFGKEICGGSERAANAIERRLAYPIDATDNGVDIYRPIREDIHPYGLHQVVTVWNSTWKEGDKQTEHFMFLVDFCTKLLQREVVAELDSEEGEELSRKAYREATDKRIVVMNDQYSNDVLAEYPEPLFVVKPARQNDNWEVECVRDDPHTFKNRKNLPAAWAGKRDGELANITGVPDAVFCHTKLFVAVTETKEGALKLAQLAIDA